MPVHLSTLQAWLKQLGVFFKERAPHQLLLPGVMDLFGHNSPHHLQHNPHAQVFFPASHSPHSYEGRCHGVDFWLHHQLPEVDVTLAGELLNFSVRVTLRLRLTESESNWLQQRQVSD